MNATPRVIAFYLPQFHPIPENDAWWGPGFTEWTNTARARPLFRGHYQPHVPADLGFYDLRLAETRAAQAAMAREYGVEAFCYWHYWFGGERLLNRPFEEVLRSGDPDFPFCLAWANESWTGIWHGAPDRVLKAQTYPGVTDHERHFEYLLEAFRDPRYVRVEGRPLFVIHRPNQVPDCRGLGDLWRGLGRKAGLPGLHLVGTGHGGELFDPGVLGLDAITLVRLGDFTNRSLLRRARSRLLGMPGMQRVWTRWLRMVRLVIPAAEAMEHLVVCEPLPFEYYPCVIPNWDNTPRSGRDGLVWSEPDPERFAEVVRRAVARVGGYPPDRRIVLVKSWNEWAEGNHLEPDLRFGHAYLKALRNGVREGVVGWADAAG